MVLVGAILLVLCLVLGAGMFFSNTDPAAASAFGVTLSNVSIGGIFLLGAAVGAVAVIAFGMVTGGAARKARKAAAHRREMKTARGEQESLAERNARLEAELERERAASLPHTDPTPADGSGTRGRH